MFKCIVCEMAKSLLGGLRDLLFAIFAFSIVLGLPVAAIYATDLLLTKYFGEYVAGLVFFISLLCVFVFCFVASIREWYLKAKEKCDHKHIWH